MGKESHLLLLHLLSNISYCYKEKFGFWMRVRVSCLIPSLDAVRPKSYAEDENWIENPGHVSKTFVVY